MISHVYDRRLKLFYVDERLALEIFRGRARITNLPEGATLNRCFYEFPRNGFGIVIQHESFEEVPEGMMIPELGPVEVDRLASDPPVLVRAVLDSTSWHIEPEEKEPYVGLDGRIN